MTTISRQPKGIPVGGQFAPELHKEPDLTLGRVRLDPESIFAKAANHTGPGVIPELERRLALTETPEGRELLLQGMDARYNQDSPYRVGRYPGESPSPDDCEALAALGYTSVNEFSPEVMKNFRGVESLLQSNISPERLQVLNRLPRHEFQWSGWEKEAYLNADLDRLEAVIDGGGTAQERYLDTVALLGDGKVARVRQALDLGLGDKGIIEADEHPLEVLRDLRNALPDSKRSAMTVVRLADKGITADRIRVYGTKACDQFTAAELDRSLVAPKTIRSFLASGVRADLDDMKILADAGYRAGSDLRSASLAMGTYDTARLAAARRHATGEELERFGGALKARVTVGDAEAIGKLRAHGITDPAELRTYTAESHPTANQNVDRSKGVLAIHADIISAGITPERFGQMQRAGIPVDEAPAFKDSADLWADGAKYREAYKANETRRAETGWIRSASPWAYTRDTYIKGPAS